MHSTGPAPGADDILGPELSQGRQGHCSSLMAGKSGDHCLLDTKVMALLWDAGLHLRIRPVASAGQAGNLQEAFASKEGPGCTCSLMAKAPGAQVN